MSDGKKETVSISTLKKDHLQITLEFFWRSIYLSILFSSLKDTKIQYNI